jgi:hypothetical protein
MATALYLVTDHLNGTFTAHAHGRESDLWSLAEILGFAHWDNVRVVTREQAVALAFPDATGEVKERAISDANTRLDAAQEATQHPWWRGNPAETPDEGNMGRRVRT